jgi:hypothetical protein
MKIEYSVSIHDVIHARLRGGHQVAFLYTAVLAKIRGLEASGNDQDLSEVATAKLLFHLYHYQLRKMAQAFQLV